MKQNTIILAAVGLGAFYVLTRKRAATVAPGATAGAAGGPLAGVLGLVDAGMKLVKGLSGGAGTIAAGTYDGRAATPWDVTNPFGSSSNANNPSAYVPDAIIANPVNENIFEWGSGADYGSQDLGLFL